MMKKLYKRLIIGTLLLTMGISISARIVAVNSSLNTTVSKIEESNKTFECNGIRMCISNYKIYDGEELNKLYDNELEDVVDNYDILFNISLENTSHGIMLFLLVLCMVIIVEEVLILIYTNISIRTLMEYWY